MNVRLKGVRLAVQVPLHLVRPKASSSAIFSFTVLKTAPHLLILILIYLLMLQAINIDYLRFNEWQCQMVAKGFGCFFILFGSNSRAFSQHHWFYHSIVPCIEPVETAVLSTFLLIYFFSSLLKYQVIWWKYQIHFEYRD